MIKSNELLTARFAPTFFIKENRSTVFKLRKRAPETIVFFLFLASYCIITTFHEPWFDEAQAWQIAKCASIADILFEIPHYEGHPPLWHLILAIPAKLGVPFELGLKSVGCIFSTASVFLILYKCCYPRFVRLILPFTYFIFYQYGIIVRPYCLMLLIMLLLGLLFPNRFSHPWRYVGLLSILCLTSAYGMLIACGIALCMAWEIVKEKSLKQTILNLFADKRTASLLSLLFVGIFLALEILPREDTYAASMDGRNSFITCLVCSLFTFMGECLLTTSSWLSQDANLLQEAAINYYELTLMTVIGIFLWITILSVGNRNNIKYLLIPYSLFALFSALIYCNVHHIGIAFLILLFWAQISLYDHPFELFKHLIHIIKPSEKDIKLIGLFGTFFCISCLLVPIFWSFTATLADIEYNYSYGRFAYEFVESHKLHERMILSQWGAYSTNSENSATKQDVNNTCRVGIPTVICAYFNRNICYNFNYGNNDDAYLHHRIPDAKENKETLDKWKARGRPDILLGKPNINALFNGEITYENYTLVNIFEINYVWKTNIFHAVLPVYCYNGSMKALDLQAMTGELANQMNGLEINDSMIRDYNNTKDKDALIKSIVDQHFGTTKQDS